MKKQQKELHGINGTAMEILKFEGGPFARFISRLKICWWVFFGKDNWRLIVKTGNDFWNWNRNEKWIATIRLDPKQKKDYDPWKDPNNLPQKWIYAKDHSSLMKAVKPEDVIYAPPSLNFVMRCYQKASDKLIKDTELHEGKMKSNIKTGNPGPKPKIKPPPQTKDMYDDPRLDYVGVKANRKKNK